MSRVLLLLPTGTYRATDFLAAASRLGVDVVVGSERRQAMAPSMGDRAVVVPLGTVRRRRGHHRGPPTSGHRSTRCWRSTIRV